MKLPQGTRVLVVTASPLLRAGLASMLEVAGSTADLDEAVALAAEIHADLLVIECDDRTIQDVIALAAESPPVLLLAAELNPTWVSDALRAGVRGVIPRDAPESEIVTAVEAAAAGLMVLHPQWLDAALAHRVSVGARAEALSPREIEVLRLLPIILMAMNQPGRNNHEIAGLDLRSTDDCVAFRHPGHERAGRIEP